MPETTPEAEPIVATAVLLLLQVPPVVSSAREAVAPTHTVELPVIADGTGLTVNAMVAIQPAPTL